MKKMNVKVVGVTFDNTKYYGGRNRQDVIKEIYETQGETVILGAEYRPRNNKPGESVRFFDLVTGQTVGYMSKKESFSVTKYNHSKYYLGHISYHGVYHMTAESISEKEMQAISQKLTEQKALLMVM